MTLRLYSISVEKLFERHLKYIIELPVENLHPVFVCMRKLNHRFDGKTGEVDSGERKIATTKDNFSTSIINIADYTRTTNMFRIVRYAIRCTKQLHITM